MRFHPGRFHSRERQTQKRFSTAHRRTIEYPESLPDALQETREQFEQEAKMAMAGELREMKRVASCTAVALVVMDRVGFLLSLHRYGVSMFDLTENEFQSDLDNA